MKTNKSFTKRLKVTKTGKLLARKPNQNHFNAKESGTVTMQKKTLNKFHMSKKLQDRFLQK